MSYYRITPSFILISVTILCDRLFISNNYENRCEINCDTRIFSYDIWAFHFCHIYFLSQSQVYHDKTSYSQFNRENFGDITLCTTRAGSTIKATDVIA